MDTKDLATRLNQCIDQLIMLRIEATGGTLIPKRAQERFANGLCLFDGEPITGRSIRGCCDKHHKALMRAIDNGEHTELEIIRNGLLMPSMPGGRKQEKDKISSQMDDSIASEISQKYGEPESEKVIIQPVGKKKATPPPKRSTTTKRKAGG